MKIRALLRFLVLFCQLARYLIFCLRNSEFVFSIFLPGKMKYYELGNCSCHSCEQIKCKRGCFNGIEIIFLSSHLNDCGTWVRRKLYYKIQIFCMVLFFNPLHMLWHKLHTNQIKQKKKTNIFTQKLKKKTKVTALNTKVQLSSIIVQEIQTGSLMRGGIHEALIQSSFFLVTF